MKCSFVVPGYKCDEYIFRNIDSILDQDYTNYEIIVVLNGKWETKNDIVSKLLEKYFDKIQVFSIDRGHLGYANNYGIERCTGDVVSCLSSDLYLMPGTLRTWIDTFKENPDCDFVYSGYKLVSDDPLDVYRSNGFNRYHLECENYIDGANPVRRNAVARWDEKLTSLIDWDYFLSVTRNGIKGYFIKEPIYYAELPKEGGLSQDSSANWVRIRREIQEKHGIPDRKICVTSLIDPAYAIELAQMAGADFRVYPGHKPHDYRLIYMYGFFCDVQDRNIQRSTGVFARHYGHKIIQWVGQDVMSLIQLRWYDVDLYSSMVLKKINHHFCYSQNELNILNKIGLTSEIFYPPIPLNGVVEKKRAISVNEPELMVQLSKSMPDQDFFLNDLSCDITVHYQDRPDKIFRSILNGNHVITNSYYPNVYHVQGFTNVPELRKMVCHTIRGIQKKGEKPSDDAINFYMPRTRPDAFRKKLERVANKHIQKLGKLEDIAHA